MKKILINIILCITFIIIYFLHSNLFTWFTIAHVMPNVFVIFVLFISLYANKITGISYGIILGLLLDLFIGKKVGTTAMMLGLVGLIGGIFDNNFSKDNRVTLITMVIVSTIVFEVGSYILSYFIYDNYIKILPFVKILAIECIYNILLTIILYPLIQILGSKIEEEYKGDKVLTRYF